MKTAVAETEFLGRENTEIYFSNWTVLNYIIPTFWPYFFEGAQEILFIASKTFKRVT